MLSVFVGTGIQIICMSFTTLSNNILDLKIAFAVIGFLSPSARGALGTVVVVMYILYASVAGYVSARLYKSMKGEHWKKNILATATIVPGLCFVILLGLNSFLNYSKSSAAVPVGTLFALISMWFLISIPLCVLGSYWGYKSPKIEDPVKTNQIPRQIPPYPFYLSKWMAAIVGGLLPFAAVFVELYFILNSLWYHRIYYMFGFLFIVFLLLITTCSLISILMCYFHLCVEDYNWQWRAFTTPATSGLYVFLYSVLVFSKKLRMIILT
jgi:transmembrane 9 superfamily protein 2/4